MRSTRTALVVMAGVAALGLAGCGGDEATSGSRATTAASAPGTSTGATFAAMMLAHHQDGIQLAQLALNRSETPGVKEVAQRSLQTQQAQLPQLQTVAQQGGKQAMAPEPPIKQFTGQEMSKLEVLSGTEFDRAWLDTFSSHHMSAVMMASTALAASEGEAQILAQRIHDEQLKDIADMNQLRTRLAGSN